MLCSATWTARNPGIRVPTNFRVPSELLNSAGDRVSPKAKILAARIVFPWQRNVLRRPQASRPSNGCLRIHRIAAPSPGGILIYNLAIANTVSENVTINRVILSYNLNGKHFHTESHVLQTGVVDLRDGKGNSDAVIVRQGAANIVLMNWKNLRIEIAEYRLLAPGSVLVGSAAFVFDFKNPGDLKRLEELAITVIDYSQNETRREILMDNGCVDQAGILVVGNRPFHIDRAGNVAYSG
jgi:hypothetical protein